MGMRLRGFTVQTKFVFVRVARRGVAICTAIPEKIFLIKAAEEHSNGCCCNGWRLESESQSIDSSSAEPIMSFVAKSKQSDGNRKSGEAARSPARAMAMVSEANQSKIRPRDVVIAAGFNEGFQNLSEVERAPDTAGIYRDMAHSVGDGVAIGFCHNNGRSDNSTGDDKHGYEELCLDLVNKHIVHFTPNIIYIIRLAV
ncbi:hypothetical protein Ancab_038911 [Ancistrocladus abbreviatus]